jgi:hypothetical protein
MDKQGNWIQPSAAKKRELQDQVKMKRTKDIEDAKDSLGEEKGKSLQEAGQEKGQAQALASAAPAAPAEPTKTERQLIMEDLQAKGIRFAKNATLDKLKELQATVSNQDL